MKKFFTLFVICMLSVGLVSAYDNIYDRYYGRPSYFTSFTQPNNYPNNMAFILKVVDAEGNALQNYEVAVYDQYNELRAVERSMVEYGDGCEFTVIGTEGDIFHFEVLYGDFYRPTIKKTHQTCNFSTNATVGSNNNPLVLTIDESGKPAEVAYTLSDVPAGAFRTVCLPYEVDCQNGTAYEIGALVPDEGLTLLPVQTMQAGKPYFVKATAQGDIDFWYHHLAAGATTRVREAVPNNGLVGTLVDNGDVPQDMYVLSSNQLYLVDSSIPFKANRAYVDLSQIASHDSNVKGLKIPFVDAVEDAIRVPSAPMDAAATYTLDGMRTPTGLRGIRIVRMSDGSIRKVLCR